VLGLILSGCGSDGNDTILGIGRPTAVPMKLNRKVVRQTYTDVSHGDLAAHISCPAGKVAREVFVYSP
jgi:hypothetical protein